MYENYSTKFIKAVDEKENTRKALGCKQNK